MNKKQILEAILINKGFEVLDIDEFLQEHYENLNTIEENINKFKEYHKVEK